MSQPNRTWFIAALLLLSGVAASARPAVVESKLNLREGPGPQHRVMLVLPAGVTVTVGECHGDWCRVDYRGQRGYASSALLKGGDAALAAAPAATKYDLDDEARVLQWNDREWRDRYWRELERQRRR